jgi:hypothetical protein
MDRGALWWVKAHSFRWIPGSVYAITVNLAILLARHEDVPVVVRTVGCGVKWNHACGARIIFPFKKQQLDSGSSTGEYAEVHAIRKDLCAQGIRPSPAFSAGLGT